MRRLKGGCKRSKKGEKVSENKGVGRTKEDNQKKKSQGTLIYSLKKGLTCLQLETRGRRRVAALCN